MGKIKEKVIDFSGHAIGGVAGIGVFVGTLVAPGVISAPVLDSIFKRVDEKRYSAGKYASLDENMQLFDMIRALSFSGGSAAEFIFGSHDAALVAGVAALAYGASWFFLGRKINK